MLLTRRDLDRQEFLEMAVSNLVGGRVRPGALLDSIYVQLRNHGRGFYHSTVSP